MDKSIIKVRSMSFKYADKYIFKDFDIDIDTNSFVCIIGRNASGKSTLVKILGGLCKASGYINVDGYLLNDTYIKKIRRSLAICFDDADRHFIGDTVFDDLAFSLENLGYFPKEIENMVNNIAKKFKIDDILDMPAEKINDSENTTQYLDSLDDGDYELEESSSQDKNSLTISCLSAGEKQLLSFVAYNIFYSNTIFFIDEPELSLHVDWQNKIFSLLKEQNPTNQFIISTHSPFVYGLFPDKEIIINSDKGCRDF